MGRQVPPPIIIQHDIRISHVQVLKDKQEITHWIHRGVDRAVWKIQQNDKRREAMGRWYSGKKA